MRTIRRDAQGISYPRQSRMLLLLIFVMAEVCESALYVISRNLSLLLIMSASLVFFGSLLVLIFVFPIFIRKDCYNCELGFHIIAHERTHLRLNSRDEGLVETETLKETRDRLIPLLLANPQMCKGCSFRLRMGSKMYSETISEYLKEKKAG